MRSQSLIQLLIAAALSSTTAAVEQCRCTSAKEGNLYARRRLAHELHAEHGFQSVKIDSAGYYIVDGVRVVPPVECEHHRNLQAQAVEDEAESRGFLEQLLARVGFGSMAEPEEVFLCDTNTVRTPPTHSGMPLEAESFLLHELTQEYFVLDHNNQLVKESRPAPKVRQDQEGTDFLVESELDCESLPKAVWFNRRALPFHCRCPSNVDTRTLPLECHDRTE
jgi:hypothetical protein